MIRATYLPPEAQCMFDLVRLGRVSAGEVAELLVRTELLLEG